MEVRDTYFKHLKGSENRRSDTEAEFGLHALLKLIVSLENRVEQIEKYLQETTQSDRESCIRLKEKMIKYGFKFEVRK